MKVLGIDPGSRVTGYGIVESVRGGSGLKHVCDGEIKTAASKELSGRLRIISGALRDVIEEFRPDAVSVESVFYSKNVKSAIVLSHVRGVALLAAASYGLKVFEYSPASVKLAVVGYGSAAKVQVQHMVKALLNIPKAPPPDAADALAVAICHINSSGPAH